MRRMALGVIGVLLAGAGFVLAPVNLSMAFTEPRSEVGANLGAVGMELFVGCAGVALAWFNLRRRAGDPLTAAEAAEQRLLAAARAHGGRITIAAAALDARITVADARERLSHLHRQGIADVELTDSGEMVYLFRGIVPGAGAAEP